MFIKAIEEDAKAWESQLKYAQALIDEWIACQRVWMYLEPIFGSEDIMRQLPTEARRFNDVDKLWRATMKATEEDPVFIAQADPAKKLKRKFIEANEKLDKIQKGLSDYLEMKRLFFPRFFFLADEQMLEILSQTKEPRAVQPHLGKAFEGLNQVKFEKDLKITQMISGEGERVDLNSPVDPESTANKGNVERWLLELENLQWESVRRQVELSLEEYPTMERTAWTLNWPAQAVIATSAIFWTSDVNKTIETGGYAALNEYVLELNKGLTAIVMLVRGQLSKLQRKTLSALVVMDVHSRDTCVSMATAQVDKVSDFNWQSQLRYYWEPSWKDGQAVKKGQKTAVARIVNARCLSRAIATTAAASRTTRTGAASRTCSRTSTPRTSRTRATPSRPAAATTRRPTAISRRTRSTSRACPTRRGPSSSGSTTTRTSPAPSARRTCCCRRCSPCSRGARAARASRGTTSSRRCRATSRRACPSSTTSSAR